MVASVRSHNIHICCEDASLEGFQGDPWAARAGCGRARVLKIGPAFVDYFATHKTSIPTCSVPSGPVSMDVDGVIELLAAELGEEPFHWERCSYTLESESGQAWPPARAVGTSFNLGLCVRMAKDPPRADGAFRWHKNCVLPRIYISIDGAFGGAELSSAAVLLSAVAVDVLTHTAHSVGLDGETIQPLVNGACAFSSLSFRTTSYNLPGKPSLHLLATLLLRQGHEQAGTSGRLHVACSSISPAITVAARKRQLNSGLTAAISWPMGPPATSIMKLTTANETGGHGAGGGANGAVALDAAIGGLPLLPFAPDLLERKLEKVDGKEAFRLIIDNSINGLRNYLSAVNIRNKCKHPLFLVLRFDTCVGLLYDSSRAGNPADDDAAFYSMMACLSGNDRWPSALMSAGRPPSGFAPYVIAVKSSHHEGHACERSDCPIKLSAALSLPHADKLQATYTLLCDLQVAALRRTYCRLFCKHACMGPLHVPSEDAQACTTCLAPPEVSAIVPASVETQRQATSLLAAVHQMAKAGVMAQSPCQPADDETSSELACPERAWEEGLRILAEALTMHCCRSRSAVEVVGFMNGAVVSAAKKPAATDAVSSVVHRDDAGGMLQHFSESIMTTDIAAGV